MISKVGTFLDSSEDDVKLQATGETGVEQKQKAREAAIRREHSFGTGWDLIVGKCGQNIVKVLVWGIYVRDVWLCSVWEK